MGNGFDDLKKRLQEMREQVAQNAQAAVEAAMKPVFDDSQGLVPVEKGLLKSTGKLFSEVDGTSATATISYGSEDTVTEWQGVGYEIFVHTPGTEHYGGVPYLEQPTLEGASQMPTIMAGKLKLQ